MKNPLSLLTLAVAGMLALPASIRAEDAPASPPPATGTATTPEAPADGKARRGPGKPGERVEHLKEVLGLTPEQVEKIKPIFEKDREAMKAVREDASLSKEQKRDKVRELMKTSADEIAPILTPEQQTKMKEEMEKRKAEMEKRRADREKK